jgi:hypothetical protein
VLVWNKRDYALPSLNAAPGYEAAAPSHLS